MQYIGQHRFPQWANTQDTRYQPVATGPSPGGKHGFNTHGQDYQQSPGYTYDSAPVQNPPGYTYNAPPLQTSPTFRPPRYSIPPPPPTPPPPPEKKSRGFFSGGWRSGVSYAAIATFLVFLVNIGLTSWAGVKYGHVGGLGIIFEGKCTDTKRASLLLHLAINTLSTVLLSASNYTAQCLSAPTRAEVDKAHARKRWLDIGIPSLRNLGKISWARLILWLLLMLSSVPLHFVYNSAVFSTFKTNSYTSVFISERGLEQFLSNNTNLKIFYTDPRTFDKLDKTTCIKDYGRQFLTDHRDVIVVTNGTGTANDFKVEVHDLGATGTNTARQQFDWICDTAGTKSQYATCNINDALALVDTWEINGGFVQYCLSETMSENCSLGYSLHIMIAVISCNAIKVICMFLAVFNSRNSDDPLVTVGDAIASFLSMEDKTTAGMCTLAKRDIKKGGAWGQVVAAGMEGAWQPRLWRPYRAFWFRAVSVWRWVICSLFALIGIFIALFALIICFVQWDSNGLPPSLRPPRDFHSLWKMGFGTVDIRALSEAPRSGDTSYKALVANVLIANTPQVVFSSLYLLYNSIFTCMLLADEWDRFSRQRRPLRVTTPTGAQRSTYFLHLPYRYSIPLMIGSGAMHWLISQSIFLARVLEYAGGKETDHSITTTGYSPIAIISAVLLACVMLCVVFVQGFRRYSGCMPLAGSCSAAISAACHTQEWGVEVLPVMWGTVKVDGPVGHCTFSGGEVGRLVSGTWYAGEVEGVRRRE